MKTGKYIFLAVVLIVIHAGVVWAIRPPEPFGTVHSMNEQGIAISPIGTYKAISIPAQASNQSSVSGLSSRSSSALQQVASQTGGGLTVLWNTATNSPHLITGRPIPLHSATQLTKDNIQDICFNFVDSNTELLRIQSSQLQLVNLVQAGEKWYVSFQQIHQGIPVFGSHLTLSFTSDDQLIMVGSDVFPEIIAETTPSVSKMEAISVAAEDSQVLFGNLKVEDTRLCILPLAGERSLRYILCWKLVVDQPQVQQKWQYLIDAVNGNIVSKSSLLIYENITGTVRGELKPEFASDPPLAAVFPHENVSARGPKVIIASWNFNSNPGWSKTGQWAFGRPTGAGNYCGDPTLGYTGLHVYGYNLNGDYTNNMLPQYLTTPPINCSGHENVRLNFMRWLGVESSYFDNASIEASNDGVTWDTIWANDTESLCDGGWTRVSYDISEIADNQPSVRIRWVMGATDSSVTYPGWNIDDVEVVTYLGGIDTVQTEADGSYSVLSPWNPAVVTSELSGLYCDIEYACGGDALFEQHSVLPGDLVDFTWNNNWYNEIVESSVYWHTNLVHDYYLAMDPALSNPSASFPFGLNYPMPVTVQLGCSDGYCNAFWDGHGMSFGAGDGVYCNSFGLYSEIIYHEYTHGVTHKIYDGIPFPYAMESGAMNEGWSDYFGCLLSPSQSPLVGDGGAIIFLPDGFRTLDNTYRRETDWTNSVHFDSQMFSGSLWEARQIVGPEIMDELVHFARYAHPQTFEDYVLAILVEDDTRYGDSDLSNGTPHAEAIYTTFGNHGLGGLQYVAPSIVIDDPYGNANGKLDPAETASLSITLSNGWANASNISATLDTTDPFVTIVKGTAGFPSLAHGDLIDNAVDPFIISLAPDCPGTHTINFSLNITANGPYSYSRNCLFTYAVAVNQLVYDDGQVDSYLGWGREGGGLAVRVTPEIYPCIPTDIRFFTSPYESTTVTVTLWDDDGPDGSPGTVLGAVNANISANNNWFDVDISELGLMIYDGSFYAGWIEGDGMYINGVDFDPPYNQRSWVYYYYPPYFEQWMPFESLGVLGNLMVRVRYSDCRPPSPVDPVPCDGAGDVPIDTLLEWNGSIDDPTDTQQVLSASDRGYYNHTGYHSSDSKNTFTGTIGSNRFYNSFFVFDLTSIHAFSITGATLRLEIEGYYSPDLSETVTVYEISTPVSVLSSTITDVAIFNDLQSGSDYGNFTVSPGDTGDILEIELNGQALEDITAARGGHFAVGLHVDTIGQSSSAEGVRFSINEETRVHELVLTTNEIAYDVYLGMNSSNTNSDGREQMTLIGKNLISPECAPTPEPNELLLKGRDYCWQVVAKNICGQVTGPVWSFTTENTQPVSNAGDDQTVFCWIDGLADVTLDGSGSYDEDGNPITYLWTWTVDGQSYSATGISPVISLPAGNHNITLVVNDGIEDSVPDEVVITAEPPVAVSVKCTPKSLNCESKGNWIKAHFMMPEGYTIDDINTSVSSTLEPLGLVSSRIDSFINEDGLLQVDVAFDRSELCQTDPPLGTNQILPTGYLMSGHCFYGTDVIRILDKKMEHLLALAENWLEEDCCKPHWCDGQDINMDGVVDLRDFILIQ